MRADFEAYLDGFSPNVEEVLEKFRFRNQIPTLVDADVLGFLLEKFLDSSVNLSPKSILNGDDSVRLGGLDNHGMGTVFEELIRRFNEENNEEAGEHFTPRDVVQLMARLIFLPVAEEVRSGTYLVYDGACGTGGMLTVAEETLTQLTREQGKEASVHLYGQEVNPETYAISKADLILKGEGGEADNIQYGSTLSADAFPAREFDLMLSNPPYGKSWKSHPRRVGSSYLLSGLVRCRTCNRALSGQDAKSGKFSYYVCQSVMKRGSGACNAPRLNARRFEELVVGKIRENGLTESNIRKLVKLVDEEMDGVAREQRQRPETIESELVDVKRRLDRLYNLVETTDLDIDDFKPRIRDHRERQEKLEASAAEARSMLSERREVLDDVETITAYAQDLSVFLNESELTERRAFIESFVKEIVVMPGNAVVRYTIPMPYDSPVPGKDAEEMALHSPVLSTVKFGGLRHSWL